MLFILDLSFLILLFRVLNFNAVRIPFASVVNLLRLVICNVIFYCNFIMMSILHGPFSRSNHTIGILQSRKTMELHSRCLFWYSVECG